MLSMICLYDYVGYDQLDTIDWIWYDFNKQKKAFNDSIEISDKEMIKFYHTDDMKWYDR